MLDEVQTLAQLEAFDPERFLQLELAPVATPSELGAVLDELRRLLDAVDRFAQKAMAIRLNLLGADPIPREFRLLLKTTVIKYHGQAEAITRVTAPEANPFWPCLEGGSVGGAPRVTGSSQPMTS